MPSTPRELLAEAEARLAGAGVPSPRVDAELLLAHVTGRSRPMVRLGGDVPVEQAATFGDLVARRATRIPLQHLTGNAPFRHLQLRVGAGVFVPRPETELLVDEVLAALTADPSTFEAGSAPGTWMDRGNATETWIASDAGDAAPTTGAVGLRGAVRRTPIVVDLCTGSAAVALAIATEAPGTRVVGVELSADAYPWAERNVRAHADQVRACGSSLELLHHDATTVADEAGPLAALRGHVDVVVTNPPYVPQEAVPREPEVRDHDPALALYGGPDGLDVVRGLARQAAILLRPGGLFVVEHADVQGEAAGRHGVPGLLRAQAAADDHPGGRASACAWRDVRDHLDLSARPRFTTAIRDRRSADGDPPDVGEERG